MKTTQDPMAMILSWVAAPFRKTPFEEWEQMSLSILKRFTQQLDKGELPERHIYLSVSTGVQMINTLRQAEDLIRENPNVSLDLAYGLNEIEYKRLRVLERDFNAYVKRYRELNKNRKDKLSKK